MTGTIKGCYGSVSFLDVSFKINNRDVQLANRSENSPPQKTAFQDNEISVQ